MISNPASPNVQQLFERAQQSLTQGATSEFNSRLLRYGRAFNLLRDSYSEYDGDPPDALIQILNQVLDGYVELYKTALLQDADEICHRRIIQSIEYCLRSSFHKNEADLALKITEYYQRMFRIELESDDKDLLTAFATELESSIFSAIKSFEDAGSQAALNQSKKNIKTAHSLCQELMKLSIEFGEVRALSSLISLHDESLHHNHIHLPNQSTSNQSQENELADRKRVIYRQIRASDDLRPVVIFSWSHFLFESSDWNDVRLVSLLEEWVTKICGNNKTPVNLYFNQELLDKDYWKNWEPIHIETKSHEWFIRGFVALQISFFETEELHEIESLSEIGIDLYEDNLHILDQIISKITNFLNRENPSSYLRSTIGRFQIHSRSQRLCKLYRSAADTVRSQQRDRILNSSLDKAKIEAYSINLNNDFKDSSTRKHLISRGILEKKPYVVERTGIRLVEYLKPRTQFLDDHLSDLLDHRNEKMIVSQFYNRYLIRRTCRIEEYESEQELEDAIRSTIKRNRSKNPILFVDTGHSSNLFEDDPDYDIRSWEDIPEDAVALLGSTPIFREWIYPYRALVLTGQEKRLVEFPSSSGPLRVKINPGEEASLSPRYAGDEESIDSENALVSIFIQYAVKQGQSIGTAFVLPK